MRIYIAAPYPIRSAAVTLRSVLESRGWDVCARWTAPDHDLDDKGPHDTEWQRHALEDLEDVMNADLLIALSYPEFANAGTGGRHVELGIAIARGIPIILIGERTNCFHYLPSVQRISEAEYDGPSTLFRILRDTATRLSEKD